jgi:hypothetical protein
MQKGENHVNAHGRVTNVGLEVILLAVKKKSEGLVTLDHISSLEVVK